MAGPAGGEDDDDDDGGGSCSGLLSDRTTMACFRAFRLRMQRLIGGLTTVPSRRPGAVGARRVHSQKPRARH
jgi:hypothetical protein